MEAIIHHHELFNWHQRQRDGEIYISGLAFTGRGYRLTYEETPRMKSALALEPRTSPLETVGRSAAEAVLAPMPAAPPMILCVDCNTGHPDGEECKICGPMSRAMINARERRHAYHLWKRGEGPKPR